MSPGAIAPQSTGTNAFSRRALPQWIARATTSLPVPDSPRRSTETSEAATFRTRRLSSTIGFARPTRVTGPGSISSARRSLRFSLTSPPVRAATERARFSASASKGFTR